MAREKLQYFQGEAFKKSTGTRAVSNFSLKKKQRKIYLVTQCYKDTLYQLPLLSYSGDVTYTFHSQFS
jgi:hypothetical protein